MKHAVGLLALLCLLVPSLGCDKATPVAPSGTTLAISANPSKIGLNGSSTITVFGRRPDGNPLNPGTEIRLSTDLGLVSPSLVAVDSSGQATATLRGDGRQGPAIVKAEAGGASVMTTVQIGETDTTKPVVLVSVNPSTVPAEGTAEVTVIARNADGSPVPGQPVILTTTLGSISPSRPTTGADGTATARFDAGSQAGAATVTAIVGASAPATATVTIRDAATDIGVQANPGTIPRAGGEVTLTAFVTNSLGQPVAGAPVTFEASFGDLEFTGVVFTDTNGVARNTLTVTNVPTGVNEIEVEASTPSGIGTLLRDSTTIDVT
jgi:adhesin/invasin